MPDEPEDILFPAFQHHFPWRREVALGEDFDDPQPTQERRQADPNEQGNHGNLLTNFAVNRFQRLCTGN
jgi:hypothetical protein